MFIVVCYDISDDGRRSKVGKILEGFGNRVQKSIFECDLQLKQVQKMKQKLTRVLKDEDSLRYYHLCGQCVSRIEVVGGLPVSKEEPYFVV